MGGPRGAALLVFTPASMAGVPAYPPDSMPQAGRHSGTRATQRREPDERLSRDGLLHT